VREGGSAASLKGWTALRAQRGRDRPRQRGDIRDLYYGSAKRSNSKGAQNRSLREEGRRRRGRTVGKKGKKHPEIGKVGEETGGVPNVTDAPWVTVDHKLASF